MSLDFALFQLINNLVNQNSIADFFFIWITHLGFIAIFVLVLLSKKKKPIMNSVFAAVIGKAIEESIKLVPYFYRARPFVEHKVNLLVTGYQTSSFPSGHTLVSFALALPLFYYNKKLGIIATIIAVLVGFSRVFVGVHYPSDVLGGFLVAVLSVVVAHYFTKHIVFRYV